MKCVFTKGKYMDRSDRIKRILHNIRPHSPYWVDDIRSYIAQLEYRIELLNDTLKSNKKNTGGGVKEQVAKAAIQALIDAEWEGKYCFELSDEVIPGQDKGRPATYQELAKYMLTQILE